MKKTILIAALAIGVAAALAAQQGGRRWIVTSSVNINGVEVARNGSAPGVYGQGYPQNGAGRAFLEPAPENSGVIPECFPAGIPALFRGISV